MEQDKVLVIGHSPGKTPINKRKNGSPTLNRLNRWLDACNVDIYSFSNLCASHKEFLKSSDIDGILIQKITKNWPTYRIFWDLFSQKGHHAGNQDLSKKWGVVCTKS